MLTFLKMTIAVPAALLIAMTSASATTITFGSTNQGTQLPTSYTEGGYVASMIGGGTFYLLNSNSCSPTCADDGGEFAGLGYSNQETFSIKAADGHAFTLDTFDGSEFPFNSGSFAVYWAAGIKVTGIGLDGTAINQTFTLDQVDDGAGGVSDFQTFTSSFNAPLTELRFTGLTNAKGYMGFGIDNVVLSETTTNVPEPASIGLLGLGLLGVSFARRKPLK